VFVSIKGGAYARFRRALETGNVTMIKSAAAELPRVSLADALQVCLVLRKADPLVYERAAIRWLGRLALEHKGITLAALHQAVVAFERMPDDPDAARLELEGLAGFRGA
jgi:hypothetical protein